MLKTKSDVVELIVALILIVIMCFFFISCIFIFNEPYATPNKMLKDRMEQFDGMAEYPLNMIIPFEWDTLYSFEAGTTKEEIEKTIGKSIRYIKDVPNSENIGCYVFMYQGGIATYVCDTHERLGYKFDLPKGGNTYGMVENNMFSIFFTNDINGYVEWSQDWQRLYDYE